MKKILQISICICLLFFFTPGTVQAAESTLPTYSEGYFYYHAHDGYVSVCGYFGSESSVEIPSFLAGRPVSAIEAGAFNGCNTVTQITIPETVMSMETGAFSGAAGLTKIINNSQVPVPEADATNITVEGNTNAANNASDTNGANNASGSGNGELPQAGTAAETTNGSTTNPAGTQPQINQNEGGEEIIDDDSIPVAGTVSQGGNSQNSSDSQTELNSEKQQQESEKTGSETVTESETVAEQVTETVLEEDISLGTEDIDTEIAILTAEEPSGNFPYGWVIVGVLLVATVAGFLFFFVYKNKKNAQEDDLTKE